MASNQNLDSFNRIKQGVTQSIQELEQYTVSPISNSLSTTIISDSFGINKVTK